MKNKEIQRKRTHTWINYTFYSLIILAIIFDIYEGINYYNSKIECMNFYQTCKESTVPTLCGTCTYYTTPDTIPLILELIITVLLIISSIKIIINSSINKKTFKIILGIVGIIIAPILFNLYATFIFYS